VCGELAPADAGSTWAWHLQPGDEVTAYDPFGDFHIKPSDVKMVYIGGGAGMAPLRAHLPHLLEGQASDRRIRLWYGACTAQALRRD
jgi:Na+-transporting NADH:ubiquinone oxidoreductase subunit F